MDKKINHKFLAKCHKWAAELSKHSPEELMDVNSAISDDARKEGVIYMFGIDADNEHVVSAGARRAHGSEQLNSFFFFEPEKSFKKFGTDGVSVCATEVCCFAALRDYFAATPYANVDAVWIEQDDGTHHWLFDGDMFPYSDFVVNDENGNRIGIGRVFSVESFEKELFAFRPSPMLTAISQEDGKSVVPVSALYWTQHANFVTRGVEGIIVNRMRERMEDDNVLMITAVQQKGSHSRLKMLGVANHELKPAMLKGYIGGKYGEKPFKIDLVATPYGFCIADDEKARCGECGLSDEYACQCQLRKDVLHIFPHITVEYRPQYEHDEKEPAWIITTDEPHGSFFLRGKDDSPSVQGITLYASRGLWWGEE